jgi:hypothetical protein
MMALLSFAIVFPKAAAVLSVSGYWTKERRDLFPGGRKKD